MFVCRRTANGVCWGVGRSRGELIESVVERVLAAFVEVGVDVGVGLDVETGEMFDVALEVGGECVVAVVRVSVGVRDVASLRDLACSSVLPLFVAAERISEGARADLRDCGVGFYDGQGHLRLFLPGLRIDSSVTATLGSRSPSTGVLAGEVAKEAAIVLLGAPRAIVGVRELARVLNRAPSTVSAALDRLRGEGLVTSRNEPLCPDLFWELAGAWRHETVSLAEAPSLGQAARSGRLRLGLGEGGVTGDRALEPVGWALTDTAAAAAWGMPVVAASRYPPDFYVASRLFVDRAVSILGRPGPGEERGATVSVAPARLVCTARVMRPSTPWPTASWVVVALDLARDQSRGREILERWKPPLGVERVW